MSKKITPIGKAPDRNEQILRAIAMKRESYFQGILYNLIQSGADASVKTMVDLALEGADYAISKLYPIKTEE